MRALILSDIHGNLPALEAVLAAAPAVDTVWNLGDIVGYGADPNGVTEIARGLNGIVIRGNHDRASSGLMSATELWEFSENARRATEWTRGVLTAENAAWLAGLPKGPVPVPGQSVICVHGSPVHEDIYIVYEHDALAAARSTGGTGIVLFGHTHLQGGWSSLRLGLRRVDPQYASEGEAESFELELEQDRRYILNPGSVGQPRDRDWRAAFAVYDDVRPSLTWYRVPYEVSRTQERILEAGLPPFLASRLNLGE